MTFKYGVTLPAQGAHKLRRFKEWAAEHVPHLEYRLPPQTPIATETMTIRVRSRVDAKQVLALLPGTLP